MTGLHIPSRLGMNVEPWPCDLFVWINFNQAHCSQYLPVGESDLQFFHLELDDLQLEHTGCHELDNSHLVGESVHLPTRPRTSGRAPEKSGQGGTAVHGGLQLDRDRTSDFKPSPVKSLAWRYASLLIWYHMYVCIYIYICISIHVCVIHTYKNYH